MMQKNRGGVTLFECLIYLALFSFIASASMFIVTRLWQSCLEGAAFERSSLSLYSAFDAFAKEIRCAPSLRKKWKLISPTALVWSLKNKEEKDRGWGLQKNKLVRSDGMYHVPSTQWKKKTSSSVAHITKAQFSCSGEEHISHVDVYFSDGITTIQETIALHNRVIHE
jgi:hypothetical protein